MPVLVTALLTPLLTIFKEHQTSPTHSVSTSISKSVPTATSFHLKSSYEGVYQGGNPYQSNPIHFTVNIQDQQGNIIGTITVVIPEDPDFPQTGTCQGKVTASHIHFTCHDGCQSLEECSLNTFDGNFMADGSIQGSVAFQSGDSFELSLS